MNRESNWWIWSHFHPILFVVWSINNPTYSSFNVDLVQQAYSSRNQQMLSGARKLYCGCAGLASKQCKGTVVYCLEIFFPIVKMRLFLRLMEMSRLKEVMKKWPILGGVSNSKCSEKPRNTPAGWHISLKCENLLLKIVFDTHMMVFLPNGV